MTERSLIAEFLHYLDVERHVSPHTVRCYAADLAQFCAYLVGDKEAASGRQNFSGSQFLGTRAVSASDADMPGDTSTAVMVETSVQQKLRNAQPGRIEEFLGFLGTQNYSKSTIARKLVTLRSLYKFCLRRGYVSVHPLAAIRTPKQDKRLPKFLEMEQISRLLATPDDNTLLGARDRAALEVLFSTGMRVSELLDLDFADVDLEGGIIRVHGKGKKQRTTPIGPTAITAIRKYLSLRRADARSASFDQSALFVNKHGQRLSTRSIRRKLDKYLSQAGLDPSVSPHTLRHSFAMHMLARGAGLRSVQQLLGHQSLSTTQVYTHLTTPRLKAAFDDAHPRS